MKFGESFLKSSCNAFKETNPHAKQEMQACMHAQTDLVEHGEELLSAEEHVRLE